MYILACISMLKSFVVYVRLHICVIMRTCTLQFGGITAQDVEMDLRRCRSMSDIGYLEAIVTDIETRSDRVCAVALNVCRRTECVLSSIQTATKRCLLVQKYS